MSDRNGGPAFPQTDRSASWPTDDEQGMTLRQWYAGLAMQAIIISIALGAGEQQKYARSNLASEAFSMADSLIAAEQEGK